ncbi:MAG: hypothetical protein WCG84_04910 [Candidatus Moraniibacteriota bacterium]
MPEMKEERTLDDLREQMAALQCKEYSEIDTTILSDICREICLKKHLGVWFGWEMFIPVVQKFLHPWGQRGIPMGTSLEGSWTSEQCMIMARAFINYAYQIKSKKSRNELMHMAYLFLKYESKLPRALPGQWKPKSSKFKTDLYMKLMLELQWQKYLFHTCTDKLWSVESELIDNIALLSTEQAADCWRELLVVEKMRQSFIRRQLRQLKLKQKGHRTQ